MLSTTALTFCFTLALWVQGVSSQNLTTATQISQSQGVRIEFDPIFSAAALTTTPPVCTAAFNGILTAQIDVWIRNATHGALGFPLAIPPLTLTATNDNTTTLHRDLSQGDVVSDVNTPRDLLAYNCNSCHTYACKVWCGCRLCSKDDDDVRRLRGNNNNNNGQQQHRRLSGVSEYSGGKRIGGTKSPTVRPTSRPTKVPTPPPTMRPTRPKPTEAPTTLSDDEDKCDVVNQQVQRWARNWVAQNDSTDCMGIASKLVVIVSFF